MQVRKRDGKVQDFDAKRIESAIIKAAKSVGADLSNPEFFSHKVEQKFSGSKTPIEIVKIQEHVEHLLQCSTYKTVAKAYMLYRHDRDISRESHGSLLASVKGFLSQEDDLLTKENANKDSKAVSTHRDLLAGIMSKHIALRHILPKYVAQAHTEGFIHVHDLDYMLSPLTNCQLVNYRDMLENGFTMGDATLTKPRSIIFFY